jgi:hypothetical protein
MWRFLKGSKRSRPKTTKRPTWRPTLEVLEDRTLPSGTNLIVNGDFEQGNTGFTTQYRYSPGTLGGAQSYDVVSNPGKDRPNDINPPNYGDHTTGTGLMMAVNGATTANQIVWSETVAVAAHSDYDFSLWLSSWFSGSPATLDIRFNNVSVGTPAASSTVGLWQKFSTAWNSGGSTSVTINIIDTNLADIGSDFALDDISLTAAPSTSAPITLSISNPAPFPKPDSGQILGMFVVTRSGDLGPAVQVDYATQDGTGANGAHAGTDYVATSGTLNFAANQTTATIAVPIIGNNVFQADKTFTVGLSHPRSNANVVSFAPQQTFAVGRGPYAVAVADLNGDGKPDLIVANRGSFGAFGNTISVLMNTTPPGASTVSFAPQQTFVVPADPQAVAVADFNGDGKPDIAVACNGANVVSELLNTTPTGASTVSFAAPVNLTCNTNPASIAMADFNGDGKPDIAVGNGAAFGGLSVFLNTTPTGASTLSFTPQQIFQVGSVNTAPVGDLNGDGKPDIAVAGNVNTVSVLLNTTPAGATTSSFAPQQTFGAGNGPTIGPAADLNGDGKPDLIVANFRDGTVSVLLNTTPTGATTASFAPQQVFAAGHNPTSVTVADFNGDGKPDIAVADGDAADVPLGGSDNAVSVLLNTTPTGATAVSFAPRQAFAVGSRPISVAAADLNGDGLPDLITTNLLDGTVSVLLNTSSGQVTLSGSPATGTISSALLAHATTTALTSDHPGGSVYGQSVTFMATVSAASGTPTGSVQFQLDGANFGSAVSLNNGAAQISTAALSAGPHRITAAYTSNSSSFLNSATTTPLVQNVSPAHLTVTANNLTVIYRTPNPALTYTLTGFVLGQTLATSGVTGAPALSTTYTASSSVGTYPITVALGTLAAKNYDFTTFVPGTLTVTYGIKVLFDQSQAQHSGSTLPVEVQLTDFYGNNVSSAGTGVHALYVASASNPSVHLPAGSPGNSQPGGDFRFTGGRYHYNLKTTGLAAGTYFFYFTMDGDPLVHSVSFIVA